MAAPPSVGGFRLIHYCPWLHKLHTTKSNKGIVQFPSSPLSTLAAISSSSITPTEESDNNGANNNASTRTKRTADNGKKTDGKNISYFPKRGQTLELVCESLAFKGKGICKVADSGFVLMCDRALPGERFIGRVTRKKDSYAEVVEFIFVYFIDLSSVICLLFEFYNLFHIFMRKKYHFCLNKLKR